MPSGWTGPEKDVSLYIEPIRGYRFFRMKFDPRGVYLTPISISHQKSVFNENFLLEPATCYYLGDNPDYCNQCQISTNEVVPINGHSAVCAHLNKLIKLNSTSDFFESLDLSISTFSSSLSLGLVHTTIVPNAECSCGYWATYNPFLTKTAVRTTREVVMLEVEVKGRFVLCERGFRASQIKITGIVSDHRAYTLKSLVDPTNTPILEDDFTKRALKHRGNNPSQYFNRINIKRLERLLPGVPFICNLDTHLAEHPVLNPKDFA